MCSLINVTHNRVASVCQIIYKSCSLCAAGIWTTWQSWSLCSVSCGGGLQTRERTCSTLSCDGFGKEQQFCNNESCAFDTTSRQPRLITGSEWSTGEEVTTAVSQVQSDLQYPVWSSWSEYSACSCYNNKQMRRRYCIVTEPRISGFCVGAIVEYTTCTQRGSCGK
jgi:hypothetical protein